MTVVVRPEELSRRPRAVAIGTFDGVHRGHRSVISAAVASGLAPTVVTFDPHPRAALGNRVELISTLERRLELLEECGAADLLVVPFTAELMRLTPEEFARHYLLGIGAEAVAAGDDFRFGARRSGDLGVLERLGLRRLDVPHVDGVSSTEIRAAVRAGDVVRAAHLLGRPFELEGVVVSGDQRGAELGYPTANIQQDMRLLYPGDGVYAGAALGYRAAVSVGTNPHFGGTERRIEPFLLDFDGDLYDRRLVVELWERLRGQEVFESELALVEQIGRDVEATRSALRPG